MHKLLLVLESALATAMQRLSASMATMATTRTPARLTATTVLTTLWVACSSAPALGSMASPGTADTMVAVTMDAATDVVTMAAVSRDAVLTVDQSSVAAGAGLKDAGALTAAASVAVIAASVVVAFAATVVSEGAPADFMAVAVDFTAVAAGTAADTDNIFGSDLTLKMAGRIHCQPFSFPEVLSP